MNTTIAFMLGVNIGFFACMALYRRKLKKLLEGLEELKEIINPKSRCPYDPAEECTPGPACDGCPNERYDH